MIGQPVWQQPLEDARKLNKLYGEMGAMCAPILPSDTLPLGIRPQWTAVGMILQAQKYARMWEHAPQTYGGGA